MKDAPTIREELDRKVSETMVVWLSRVDLGEADPRDAKNALQLLWDMSAGLTSNSVKDALSAGIKALDAHPATFAPSRVYMKNDKLTVVSILDDEKIRLTFWHGRQQTLSPEYDDVPAAFVSKKVKALEETLTERDWCRVI